MRYITIAFLVCISNLSLAQTPSINKLVLLEIEEISKATVNSNLSRIVKLADHSVWDSVLYYTANQDEFKKDPAITSHYHYLRALAFFSKEMYKQSEKELIKVSRDVNYYNFVRFRIAEVAFMQGKYKNAYYKYSLVDTLEASQLKYISKYDLYSSIGRVSYFLKRFEISNKYMRLAEKLMSPNLSLNHKALFYTDYANLYYEQYMDSLAMGYFLKAQKYADESGHLPTKVLCTCNLAQVNLNGGRYEKSAKLFEKCRALTLEQYDIDKIWEVGQMEKKLMLKVKQKEISNLASENKIRNLQRNVFVILAVFLLLILVMGFYQYQVNQKRAKVIFAQKEALDQLNATKDQLFSIIGHDLRSSVNAMRSGTQNLERSLVANDMEQVRNQMEQNSVIAANTYNLLDNLLQWSLLQTKGGYFSPEEHKLSLLVDQVAFNYNGVLDQRKITFTNDIPRTARVWVDAESLKLVMRNLMDNSIKFSKENGNIHTTIQDDTSDTITFVWSDDGAGMSEETRFKLLHAKRLERKEHEHTIGTGLGMQLVISMIDRNGGTIDILSEVGKGTKMLVTLRKKGHGETEDTRG